MRTASTSSEHDIEHLVALSLEDAGLDMDDSATDALSRVLAGLSSSEIDAALIGRLVTEASLLAPPRMPEKAQPRMPEKAQPRMPEKAQPRTPLRPASPWVTVFTWIRNFGALLLLFVAWQLWGTSISQHHAQSVLAGQFAAKLHKAKDHAEKAVVPARAMLLSRASQERAALPPAGTVVARLQIPGISVDQFVVEGTAENDLAQGPGHYIGTALPGYAGNVAIAGHRTTYGAPFNRLAGVVAGDSIYLTTTSGERLRYVVRVGPKPVAPTDVAILDDFGDDRITLTTCTPEFSAAERLVVVGYLVDPPATLGVTSTSPARHVSGSRTHPVAVTIDSSPTGWNFGHLPEVLVSLGLLVLLGAENRRLVRWLGRWRGWVLLTPIWCIVIVVAFAALSALVPASL